MPTVGIPRALLYYQYYPMWRTFFEALGARVVVSSPTTKGMLAEGSSRLVAETCLPTKVFCGHVASLHGQADYAFVPAIRSLEPQVYNCSKFLGLPDLVQGTLSRRPAILTIDIDVNLGRGSVLHQLHQLGSRFTRNPFRIKRACDSALAVDGEYQSLMVAGLTPPEAILKMYGENGAAVPDGKSVRYEFDVRRPLTVALIGHPYNVYDGYISHNLLWRLRSWGIKVVTAEMASREQLDQGTVSLVGRPYWTYEDEVVGAAGHYLSSEVDGVISIVSFACGPDSIMLAIIQRAAKEPGAKPLLSVTIDEHTGEAGLVTRLEAFVDMLVRRKYGAARGRGAAADEGNE